MTKIAIFGQWRTGTTGLFYKIKNSLPPKTPVYFEPSRYKKPFLCRDTGYELAKVILGSTTQENKDVANYEEFMHFDKKILIVRDPRDWLVSGLLFLIQQYSSIYSNQDRMTNILELLAKKEGSPDSISVVKISETILNAIPDRNLDIMVEWIQQQHELVYDFERGLDDYFLIKYEDFIDGMLSELQNYLGIKLEGEALVDDVERSHIPRTKNYGNWKNWYTEKDIEFFKPVFSSYLDKYGYPDSWETNSEKYIDPEYCSKYVKKTVQNRIRQNKESLITKKIREIRYRLSYI